MAPRRAGAGQVAHRSEARARTSNGQSRFVQPRPAGAHMDRQYFSDTELRSEMKIFTFAAVAALILPAAFAEDWPQWGGADPGRNMYSPAKNLPVSFNPGKLKAGSEDIAMGTTKNVRWDAKLGSQSYGNPVIANGKVYVGTNNETPRNKKHLGDRSILLCLDEKTGELLWQLVIPKLASGKVNDWENLGLLSSPCVEGNRVYLVTSRCEVICLDTEGLKNGNDGDFKDEAQYIAGPGKAKEELTDIDADIIWKYDMMDELGVFPHNASNCSVEIVDDLHRTIRCVVRKDPEFIHHVVFPDDVGVDVRQFFLRLAWSSDVLRLVLEVAVVAVLQAFGIEANDFAAARHEINAISLPAGRRKQSEIFPIIDFAGREFRDDQLPEQLAGFLIQAQEDRAVTLVPFVAGRFVVRADVNFSVRDHRQAVALRTEFGGPAHVLRRAQVDVLAALL